MKKFIRFVIFLLLFGLSIKVNAETPRIIGQVCDIDGKSVAGAEIWSAQDTAVSADDGFFQLYSDDAALVIRRPGYKPLKITSHTPQKFVLHRLEPRALYLSYWAADSRDARERILRKSSSLGFNALVVDLKSVRGDIAFRSNTPLATRVGAQKMRTLKDLPEFLAELKQRGIYTIGRIAVFKDDRLAKARHKMAALSPDGYLWKDRDKISWTDPFNRQVHDYNIAIAEEAAALGVDEIQFDYIRFPARSDLIFSYQANDRSRVAAVNAFLKRAKKRLAPYPVMTSANTFGYICWKHKDGKIGQRLGDMAQYVDYLSPMLYPSGFPHGVPGYADPVAHPYETIELSLKRAQKLTGLEGVRFRPWLQAFKDYAFDRRHYRAPEVQAQIKASAASSSHGWMLWNAASRFSLNGLSRDPYSGHWVVIDPSKRVLNTAALIREKDQTGALPLPDAT